MSSIHLCKNCHRARNASIHFISLIHLCNNCHRARSASIAFMQERLSYENGLSAKIVLVQHLPSWKRSSTQCQQLAVVVPITQYCHAPTLRPLPRDDHELPGRDGSARATTSCCENSTPRRPSTRRRASSTTRCEFFVFDEFFVTCGSKNLCSSPTRARPWTRTCTSSK